MNLANKNCYPQKKIGKGADGFTHEYHLTGLTFKERLVIALASNSGLVMIDSKTGLITEMSSVRIVTTADAIIKRLEDG